MPVEHTLSIINPEGMPNEKKIIKRFKLEGFIILAKRHVHLTPEQVSDFYQERYGRRDFPLLVASISVDPVTALCLGRVDAVNKLKEVAGPHDVIVAKEQSPNSINALYGNTDCNLPAVHASEDSAAARREISFFFPQSFVEPMKSIPENLQYLDKELRPLLKEGLSQVLKEKPVEPMLWLAQWLIKHNTNRPNTQEHLNHQHF